MKISSETWSAGPRRSRAIALASASWRRASAKSAASPSREASNSLSP
jgi:hypothetical protein